MVIVVISIIIIIVIIIVINAVVVIITIIIVSRDGDRFVTGNLTAGEEGTNWMHEMGGSSAQVMIMIMIINNVDSTSS